MELGTLSVISFGCLGGAVVCMSACWGYATLKEQGYFNKTKEDPKMQKFAEEEAERTMHERYTKFCTKHKSDCNHG